MAHSRTSGKKIQSEFSVFGKLPAFFSGAAIEEALRKNAEYSHMIGELAKRTGQSTDEIQKWDYAATKAGIPLESLVTWFEKFQILQAKARAGDKSAFDALTRLGLNPSQINSLKDAAENFKLVGDHIKGAAINGQMLKDITLAFGRSGREIIPVFKNDLREVGDEVQRLGGLMSAKQLAYGAEAAERMKLAWFQIRPLVGEVTSFLARRLLEISDFFRLTIGVMITDLQARRDATKRGETFWDRTKENWRGQKDTVDVDKAAAEARRKYIDRVMDERKSREEHIAKMEADFKNPKPLPDYKLQDTEGKADKVSRLQDDLARKQQAHELGSLAREQQIQLLYERRLAIYNAMQKTTSEEGKLQAKIDIEDIDEEIRKKTGYGSVSTEHPKASQHSASAHPDLNQLQRIGGMHVTMPAADKQLEVLQQMHKEMLKI